MSAMLVEQQVTAPATSRPRWRHVPQTRGPVARPSHPVAPGVRPVNAAMPLVRVQSPAPVLQSSWQLTRRGLKLVIGLFLAMVTAATVTLIGAFFSVPNDPVAPTSVPAPAAAFSRG